MTSASTNILLVGSEGALLEGLSQSLAAMGYRPRVASGTQEAVEMAAQAAPLIVVAASALAAEAGADLLRIPLVPGGALVLYHSTGRRSAVLTPTMQRAVLAELALPLERHRLVALVQHVAERARATGRRLGEKPPEQHAE